MSALAMQHDVAGPPAASPATASPTADAFRSVEALLGAGAAATAADGSGRAALHLAAAPRGAPAPEPAV